MYIDYIITIIIIRPHHSTT